MSAPRASTSTRDALAALSRTEEDARNLHESVREALRGRGASRRDACAYFLDRARGTPSAAVPLLLAVRDELAREESPPRGLAGRVDALLLELVAADEPVPGRRGGALPARARGPVPLRRTGERVGRLLRRLLALSPDAVLTVRASGRLGLWNRAGAEITGRRHRSLQDVGVRALFRDPDTYDELLDELERRGDAGPRETFLVREDGGAIPVRVFAARLDLLTVARRDPDRHLFVLHDLTEVHRIRSRLYETEKLSAMAKIAGSVAHEFRNPLNSLFLSADLLEDELQGRGGVEEAIAPTLAAIREEVERLNQIITHYLALSKVETSEPVAVDLGETVTAFVEEWAERATEHGVEIKARVQAGDLAVTADPDQIRRVLVNLVENALDALCEEAASAAERSRAPAVVLRVRSMRRTVKLTVKDNGPGIPEDQREQVFEPFFTSKSRGSGLGLYLVREIVLAHGGAISLAGNGGRGTAVVLHWPRPSEGSS